MHGNDHPKRLSLAVVAALVWVAAAPAQPAESPVAAVAALCETFDTLPCAERQARLGRLVAHFPNLRQTTLGDPGLDVPGLRLTAVAQTALLFLNDPAGERFLEAALAFAEAHGDWDDVAFLTVEKLRRAEALTAPALEALLARCAEAKPASPCRLAWVNLQMGLSPRVPKARRVEALRQVAELDAPYDWVFQAAQKRFNLQATDFSMALPQLLPPAETLHAYTAQNVGPVACTLTDASGETVRAWTVTPAEPSGHFILPALPEGDYLLSLQTRGRYTHAPLRDTHRFAVGCAAPFRLASAPETFLTLDTRTGQPLPGVTVTYRRGDAVLGSATSDAEGLLAFPTPALAPGERLRAEVSFGGRTVRVEGRAQAGFDLVPPQPKPSPRLDLRLDRRIVRPGETLRFAGFLADAEGRALATNATFTVTAYAADLLADAPGTRVADLPVRTDASGTFAGTFRVPDAPRKGALALALGERLGTTAVILPRGGRHVPSPPSAPDEPSPPRATLTLPPTPPRAQTPFTLGVSLPAAAGRLGVLAVRMALLGDIHSERLVETRALSAGASRVALKLPAGEYIVRLFSGAALAPVAGAAFEVKAGEDTPEECPDVLALACERGLLDVRSVPFGTEAWTRPPLWRDEFRPISLSLRPNGLPQAWCPGKSRSPEAWRRRGVEA